MVLIIIPYILYLGNDRKSKELEKLMESTKKEIENMQEAAGIAPLSMSVAMAKMSKKEMRLYKMKSLPHMKHYLYGKSRYRKVPDKHIKTILRKTLENRRKMMKDLLKFN